jgi:hypothetical protein
MHKLLYISGYFIIIAFIIKFMVWIYNYLCNQWLTSLTLWVRIPLRRVVLDTRTLSVTRGRTVVFSSHKQLDTVIEERDNYQKEIEIIKRHNSDDFYLPQIKEVCYVILGTFWTGVGHLFKKNNIILRNRNCLPFGLVSTWVHLIFLWDLCCSYF